MTKKRDNVETAIIDIIWFVGTMLEPAEPYPLPSPSNTKEQTPAKIGMVCHSTSSFRYKALCNFIEQLHNEDLLSTDKLSARLDASSLLSSLNGVINKANKPLVPTSSNGPDPKNPVIKRDNNYFFLKQLRKKSTNTYYRQKRYNLLREESEGYAKLLNFLNGGLLIEEKQEEEDENVITATDTSTGELGETTKNVIPIEEKIDIVKLQTCKNCTT